MHVPRCHCFVCFLLLVFSKAWPLASSWKLDYLRTFHERFCFVFSNSCLHGSPLWKIKALVVTPKTMPLFWFELDERTNAPLISLRKKPKKIATLYFYKSLRILQLNKSYSSNMGPRKTHTGGRTNLMQTFIREYMATMVCPPFWEACFLAILLYFFVILIKTKLMCTFSLDRKKTCSSVRLLDHKSLTSSHWERCIYTERERESEWGREGTFRLFFVVVVVEALCSCRAVFCIEITRAMHAFASN